MEHKWIISEEAKDFLQRKNKKALRVELQSLGG